MDRRHALVSAVSLFALGAAQPSAPSLPDSELPVSLLGVALDEAVPAKSACVVRCSYPGDKQIVNLVLTVGQRACDVGEIAEIRQNSVVIRNLERDRLELLTFPSTAAASQIVVPPVASQPLPVESPNLVNVEIQKDLINSYLANLPELMNSVIVAPRYREVGNGQSVIDGFEIKSFKVGSAIGELGLQNGDVLLEVNGSRLDSAASVLRLLGQSQVMTQTKLIVLRNGQQMTFVVHMK
jgi:general secretion pathway protein C